FDDIGAYSFSLSWKFTNSFIDPHATADANNNAPLPYEVVSFTGRRSISLAPGSSIVRYDWQFGDGTSTSGRDVQHSFSASNIGTALYVVTLTVTDSYGRTSTDHLWITVTGRGLGLSDSTSFSLDPVNLATGNYICEH